MNEVQRPRKMKTLKDLPVAGKRVLLRCDFDVPLTEAGQVAVADDYRIQKAVPTIEYLIEKRAKVILMAHLGRPHGKVVEQMRLAPVQGKLMEYLGLSITKAQDCVGPEIEEYVSKMQEGEILLLENLRFHKEEEEGGNDDNFARQLAKLGDFYVNDAFANSHRNHASMASLPKYLPSAAGLFLEKEVKILSRILHNPWRPLAVIIGGVKIDSKIDVIEQFLEKADHLLLGGEIANTILQAKSVIVGKLMPPEDVLKKIEKIDITNPKLHLPLDGLISLENRQEQYFRVGGVGSVKKEESVFDIGPETIKVFSEIIKSAKMILWSGPLGVFEQERFERGTREVALIAARNHAAFKAAGGGDTISSLNKFNLTDKFDHISTGGGAMLEFLSGKTLPGLEALK